MPEGDGILNIRLDIVEVETGKVVLVAVSQNEPFVETTKQFFQKRPYPWINRFQVLFATVMPTFRRRQEVVAMKVPVKMMSAVSLIGLYKK